MKKSYILASLMALTTGLAHATSEHDNTICFNMDISQYNVYDGSITKDQPFESQVTRPDNKKNCLTITAGRHLSTTPKQWVQESMEEAGNDWVGGNMTSSTASIDSTPDKLNFAIALNITFNNEYECLNIFIGQGNAGAWDNWWLFSNNNLQKHYISCLDTKTLRSVLLKVDGENYQNFTLSVVQN